MTVKQLRKLLRHLPADMDVFMPTGEVLTTVCEAQSEVIEIETEDDVKEVLLLVPCSCHDEPIHSEHIVNPELN